MKFFSRKKPQTKTYPNEYPKEFRKIIRNAFEISKDTPDFTLEQIKELSKKMPNDAMYLDLENPKEMKIRHLALSCSMSGHLDECISYCNEGIELNPNSPYLLYLRGRTYSDLKQFEKAMEDLSKAVQFRENFADVWYEIGRIHHMNNDMDNAILGYYKAYKLEPDYYKIFEKDPDTEEYHQGELIPHTQTLNENGVKIVLDYIKNPPENMDLMLTGYFPFCIEGSLVKEFYQPPKNIRIMAYSNSDQKAIDWFTQLSDILNQNGIKTKFKKNEDSFEIDTYNETLDEWHPAVIMGGRNCQFN